MRDSASGGRGVAGGEGALLLSRVCHITNSAIWCRGVAEFVKLQTMLVGVGE